MSVHVLLSVLRNCIVNFLLASNESHLATAYTSFSGTASAIKFCDLHFDKDKLFSLTVTDVYCKGPGLIDVYVD